ncbi:tRNA (adenosine(37)-N6)-threonylcarbamoyltransferase complex ATPase subunit type 1 TsaE [candidate division Kazan bacterium RIFCSPLOWO2_01_FULL_48_13]|uniref:tRNA threonylcarbamoyladenosine biosynthesis protein TsaE n=1 Tax=candidate division Kazan bacterium RIFCSPLOWO2_01_FULL_48_13 TaxID=1798539 RepID=A0A1F4PN57_UNCK3|nr:MAG: tRNA (adenosine(37)-N6)-threonylcarbamoyltransferase complex ATPase subunit type 1 TsaE [candidate division Kazan bacterium RIFCSPLOWO2_01_FULL_48_13]
MLKLITKNSGETKAAGERLAKRLKPPAIIAFRAPLGGGKTVFIQGLAHGLGVRDRVVSPTFVLERIYKIPKRTYSLYHYDLYRIKPDDLLIDEILENAKSNIVAIEWSEKMNQRLPKSAIRITIKPRQDDIREITIT